MYAGIAGIVEPISVALPAGERHLVFHPASRLSTLWITSWKLAFVTLPFMVGTPRYLPKSSVHSISRTSQVPLHGVWRKVDTGLDGTHTLP